MATLSSLVVNLEANTAKYSSKMRGASKGMQSFRSAALRAGGALLAVFGGRAILRGLASVRKAFGVQEQAVIALRASLIATGKDGAGALERITARAAELQKVTTAGDEAIIAATASFALLAPSLDAASLEKAQEAIIGIAETFTKGDLEAAALLIGKSVGSSTNALTRYGIQLDTTATAQEKLASVVDQSARFFDVAKAKALGSLGAMAQLSNAFGDVKEAIGKVIEARTGFTEFIERHINKYQNHRELPLHFIGSMAFFNKQVLSALLSKNSLRIGVVLKSPMEGLLKYHLQNNT